MILCDVIGCELEHKAKAIVAYLEGGDGRARCNSYNEYHPWCDRCQRVRHWERLEDGRAHEMRSKRSDAA